jgi:hypothetical protein
MRLITASSSKPSSLILRWLDTCKCRRTELSLSLILVVFSALCYFKSNSSPFWFDELLGLSAATAPNLKSLMAALASPVDINPPLYHILMRYSIQLFGLSTFAARLPAFIGMVSFLLCVYLFIARRLTPKYGVLGVLCILSTLVPSYAWDARPYGVVLGLTGLGMILYQRRAIKTDFLSLAGLVLVSFLLPLTHYYAVAVIPAFLVAELAGVLDGKAIDWKLVISLPVATLLSLVTVYPLIRTQLHAIAHYHSRGSLTSFISGYGLIELNEGFFSLSLLAIVFAFLLPREQEKTESEQTAAGFSFAELGLAVFLFLLPFFGVFITKVTHAYVPRYFISCSGGMAILVCYVAFRTLHKQSFGVEAFCLVAFAALSLHLCSAFKQRHNFPGLANLSSAVLHSNIPIIFEDAKDYLQAKELNPSSAGQFYYAAEPSFALKFEGTDSDARLMLALAHIKPVQVLRIDEMPKVSSRWLLIKGEVGWLSACTSQMGLAMTPVSLTESIQEAGSTNSDENSLSGYIIQLPAQNTVTSNWCERPK